MAISTAVDQNRRSRVVGYQIKQGNFGEVSPNLPQSIAIVGEANANNQTSLDTTPREITSAVEAAELYGYGSPIHLMMRVLRPQTGSGVGGVPTVVYPQLEAAAAAAAERTVTVAGTPTANATHKVSINGREDIDGGSYSFTVLTTDTPTLIADKMADAINAAISSPVIATADTGVLTVVAKWKGKTSEQLNIDVLTEDADVGLTYTVASTVVGVGSPTLAVDFGSKWHTIVLNSYDEDQHAYWETMNGTPDAGDGRYTSTVFKPFIAAWGSTLSDKDAITAITDATARQSQVTNVLCPAPNSKGFTFEASANGVYHIALVNENTPHLDVNAKVYPDMPTPKDENIGDFSNYDNRDFMVKKGASTVDLVSGEYVFQDLVTTYHPTGELVPAYRYVRSLMQDWNIYYGYYLLEQLYVIDHAIAENDQQIGVEKVIKPKKWVQVLSSYFDDLAVRSLIVEPEFSQESTRVQSGDTNPDRMETAFSYKRSPYVRVASTTVEAGFAFGLRS